VKTQTQVITVKQLTRHIKGLLETDPLLSEIWVKGEISNFVHHSRGHMYFTLKDEESRIRSIMFAGNNQFLKFLPKDGMRVLAKGYISLFERDGQYQFYVQEMQPDGLGNLFLAYEQLKQKLETEGLFHPARKREIRKYPNCIGVVTSPTGAAIRDILTTLYRRYPTVRVVLFPVLVQGEHAAASIARAIKVMNELNECDVLIVGRGGGSLEELWAFNEEVVARSIFASKIPVISAVGHETDVTIADFVADIRAATPTAAAEIAVPHMVEVKQNLSRLKDRLAKSVIFQAEEYRERLSRLQKSQVFRRPKQQLEHYVQQLDHFQDQLIHGVDKRIARSRNALHLQERKLVSQSPEQKIKFLGEQLRIDDRRLKRSMDQSIKQYKQQFGQMLRQLDTLSPLKIMDRGYSLIYEEKNHQLVKSIDQVSLGDILRIRLKDGILDCQVWSMEVEPDGKRNKTTTNDI
jgi:exodeoxyribonuclease VII large subunit